MRGNVSGGVLSANSSPDVGQFAMDELRTIVAEARRVNKKVASHAQSTKGILNALNAGVNSIEHGIYIDNEGIDLMLAKDAFLVPTLIAPFSVIKAGEEKGNIPEYALNKAKKIIDIHFENISKAIKSGVKVVLGTDAAVGPHGEVGKELLLLQKAGLSNKEVLLAATRLAAECLDMQDQIGTIEIGKLADLLIIKGNPLENLNVFEIKSNIKNVIIVCTVVK